MKFKINNCEWEIIELTNDQMIEIAKKYREVKEYEYYRGYTSYVENKIYLNTINVIDMKHVLYHELVHAYLYSFGLYDFDSYGEEDVCNIASRSFFIINEIIEKYFK